MRALLFEESFKTPLRRSKLEITCDILGVISKGNGKPTRIMQLANVTWDDLMLYLEALIRNGLISRRTEGKRVRYTLTGKGSTLLGHYLSLKREAAPLQLETLTRERISKALTYLPAVSSRESVAYKELERRLEGEGFTVVGSSVRGKSGAVHKLGLVAVDPRGAKHGYIFVSDIDEMEVMRIFIIQLDADLNLHALYSGNIPPKVGALAKVYSLDLSPWGPAEKKSASG
jgi:predicted transcriptional regulator